MQLEQIIAEANYQQNNWINADGEIAKFDIHEKTIGLDDGREFNLNPNAYQQTFDRLGIKGTLNDLDETIDREALQTLVEYMIQNKQKTESRVIYDRNSGEAKAVKSNRYNVAGVENILNLARANNEEQYFSPNGSYIDDKWMNLRYDNVKKETIRSKLHNVGDEVGFGISISISDVGLGGLGLLQSVMRLACTNGAVSKESIRLNSLSHNLLDIQTKMVTAIRQLSDTSRTVHILEVAMDREPIIRQIEDIRRIPELIEVSTSRVEKASLFRLKDAFSHINNDFYDGIITAHEQEPQVINDGINGWQLHNDVTRFASHLYPVQTNYDPYTHNQLLQSAYQLLTI